MGLAAEKFGRSGPAGGFDLTELPGGLKIAVINSAANDFEYIIVYTRAAGGAVAAQQSTWGEIKSLYQGDD